MQIANCLAEVVPLHVFVDSQRIGHVEDSFDNTNDHLLDFSALSSGLSPHSTSLVTKARED